MNLKELLNVIEDIKKDLAYTKRLEERWIKEQKRFPLIYKYIIKQREFFQEKIDAALSVGIDLTKLDDYVAKRPDITVQKLKTAVVTPPKEEDIPVQEPKTEKPEIKAPVIDKSVADSLADTARFEDAEPPPPEPEPEVPDQVSDDEAKKAEQALEEAAAAAAQKLRTQSQEPATQSVARKIAAEKEKSDSGIMQKPPQESSENKASSREKLKRLASEVLNEVKKSKTK